MSTTSTSNFPGSLVPVFSRGAAVPYTEKQRGFFRAVEHGFKPDRFDTSLTPGKAKELLSHEKRKVDARRKGQTRALEKL